MTIAAFAGQVIQFNIINKLIICKCNINRNNIMKLLYFNSKYRYLRIHKGKSVYYLYDHRKHPKKLLATAGRFEDIRDAYNGLINGLNNRSKK